MVKSQRSLEHTVHRGIIMRGECEVGVREEYGGPALTSFKTLE